MSVSRAERAQAYLNKARHELQELEEKGVQAVGNAFSSILFVKGQKGPAELAGGALLSGKDGQALRAALLRLGYAPEDWVAVDAAAGPELFRQAVAVLDPATIVACDEEGAACLRDAFAQELADLQNLEDAMLAPGHVVTVAGMRMMNLGGFEAALSDAHQKQIMWARLKRIPPLGEPY